MGDDSPASGVGGAFARIAATKVLLARSRSKIRRRKNLWEEAATLISKEDRTQIPSEGAGAPTRILGDIEGQVQQAKQKQWKFRKRSGEEVAVREVFEKITTWVTKFKELGDIASGIDPVHVGLPWAAVRFFLQLAVSDIERYSAMIEGAEIVSGIIARYAEVEKAELIGRSNLKTQLENGLIKLYATVLSYLAETKRYYASSTGKRMIKSLNSQSAAEQWLDRMATEDDAAHRLVTLVQAENQTNRLFSIRTTLLSLEESILQAKTARTATRHRLLERLGATYTDDNYDGSLSLRQEGTASWIFEREVFKKWMEKSTESHFLWIYGPPGFGKTVLAASVVEHLLKERRDTTAYFFCVSENEAKREPVAILTSWIAQLIEQNEDAVKFAGEVINLDDQRAITRTDQWRIFGALCSRIKGCAFVMDGFDECTSWNKSSRFQTEDARAQFLRELFDAISTTKADVLMVSRETAEIRTEVFRDDDSTVQVSHYGITESDTKPDIQTVSRHVVDFRLHKKPEEVRTQLAEKAAEKAEGMFLWVHLLSQKLKPGSNVKKLDAVVSQMPTGLEQAYERDLRHIYTLDEDEKNRAINILRWVLFAARPLTVRELVEALILNGDMDEDESYPEDELPDNWKVNFVDEDYVNDVLRQPLGSLIALRSRGENEPLSAYTVHFVHYSVKEYLLRPNASGVSLAQEICFPNKRSENDLLARLCLQYLCYDVFGSEEVSARDEMKTYPFFRYAARTWYHHALSEGGISPDLVSCARRLLDPETFNWVLWSRTFEIEEGGEQAVEEEATSDTESDEESSDEDSDNESSSPTDDTDETDHGQFGTEEDDDTTTVQTARSPIYYASLLGLLDVVKRLHEDGVDINVVGGLFGTPLQAAIVKGHTPIVRYLVENDADLTTKAGMYTYAICAGAWAGDFEVVQLLIDHGADLEPGGPAGQRRPVHLATYHPDILRVLIDRGVDLNAPDSQGSLPLHWATIYGHLGCAQLLIEAGVDVNSQASSDSTACLLAVQYNHGEMLAFLLSQGADPNIADSEGRTPLFCAAGDGKEEMVLALLSHGAVIECETDKGFTPLIAASLYPGHPRVVKHLLEHGADTDHSESDGWTALHFSSRLANTEIMSLLLEHGADVEAENTSAMTPILQAGTSGSTEALELLLGHGADITHYDIDGDSILDYAMQQGHHDFVQRLLEKDVLTASVPGKAVDTRFKQQRIELNKAIFAADLTAVEAILNDTQTDSLDIVLQTALHAASLAGSTTLAKFLLRKGASTETITPNKRSALHYAAVNLNLGIVKLLLEAGSAQFEQDLRRSYPLNLAIQNGLESKEVVEYFIRRHGFGPNLTAASAALIEAWRLMAGKARGTLSYTSWRRGRTEKTSWDIVRWDQEATADESLGNPPTFLGSGTDEAGTFKIYGSLYGKSQVIWAKLYRGEKLGWLYSGTLDTETRTITGNWGTNAHLWHGTFKLKLIEP
ncbi:ankyrin repeat-containing domain protein [Aspergillus heterothallicus]